jgi:hypothetical protein
MGESPLVFDSLEVVATELTDAFGVQALLGRDVLERCLLVYHGPERQFTLVYRPAETPDMAVNRKFLLVPVHALTPFLPA